MSDKSKIEWTDATWNPIRGCSRVSEGCRNCYAEKIAARFSGPGQPYQGLAWPSGGRLVDVKINSLAVGGKSTGWTGEVRFIPELLDQPLRWKKPRRIFVNSMSDLFHEKVQTDWLKQIFGVMVRCPQHTFQVLTKRPHIMKVWMDPVYTGRFNPDPPSNIWCGVSVEDQKTADERIPLLLQTPAAVRWVSYEPALGPVDFRHIHFDNTVEIDSLTGDHGVFRPLAGRSDAKLNWIVAGGESGPGARPMHPDWARAVRDQCQTAGVPFFFKQWGEWIPVDQHVKTGDARLHRGTDLNGIRFLRLGKKSAGRLLDGREWSQYPELQVVAP